MSTSKRPIEMGFQFKFQERKKQWQIAGVVFGGLIVLGVAGFVGSRLSERSRAQLAAQSQGSRTHASPQHTEDHGGQHAEDASHDKRDKNHASVEAASKPSFWSEIRVNLGELQSKVVSLHLADEENQRLKLENSYLRAKLESSRFEQNKESARGATDSAALKLNQETGSRLGRTLASIAYKPPGHLLPAQLHTLAISYFKAREDEKAAVLLSFLTGLEDNDTYQTPRNFLMNAVAWYRLDNFEVADVYLDKVLRFQTPREPETHAIPETRVPATAQLEGEVPRYQAQARIWKGLIAKRRGQNRKAQAWLREVIDHHPNSEEASWVNTGVIRHEGVHEE